MNKNKKQAPDDFPTWLLMTDNIPHQQQSRQKFKRAKRKKAKR